MATENKRMALVCVGLAACNALVAAAQAQGVSFEEARNFAAGDGPTSIAMGDFNGDGLQDLAVAGYGEAAEGRFYDNVRVLRGTADGSFRPLVIFADAGRGTAFVAVGDFNSDGVPDLAVANVGSNDVSVRLGNGDGSFQAVLYFAAGSHPSSVAVGDFNGDGVPDLAVAYAGLYPAYAGGVSVLLGNGDGSFQAAQNFAAGSLSQGVAVGDFDGDGVQDLAVANSSSNNVSVLLGNGDGSFQAAQNFAAGSWPVSEAVGDFNGDGLPDLAVANDIAAGTVTVLLGNGDGTFQAAQNFAARSYPSSVAVGDFNGDGLLDLAVANDIVAGTVTVLLGNGDGSFQAPRAFAAQGYTSSVAVGDFNGDGLPDLAVANQTSNSVSVLSNNTHP